MRYFFFLLLTILCENLGAQQIDIQGHRGARGMMPENTIPAFLYAMDNGVTTLELDVVISKDGQVVVSHEPWMSHEICLDSSGNTFDKNTEKKYNIFQMQYQEVAQFDCGTKGNDRFIEQTKIKVSKPLLEEVIAAAEAHAKGVTYREIFYNIELKSQNNTDGILHPTPEEFSKIVYQLIDQYLPWQRVTIQSFDFRVLQYWHQNYPDVQLAALVENTKSIKANLDALGFKPAIYSPYFKLLSNKKVAQLHDLGIKVVPWTVNEAADMKQLVSWKVDGLITDYPNRAKQLGLTLPTADK